MIYSIPVIGWLIGLFFQISMAIPLYFAWNAVAPIYFSRWLYPEWLSIPFWNMVGLIVSATIIKCIILPRFNVELTENSNKNKGK